MAKKQFKAESKRLLDLMINSIYTHKEIFLREIISNASDAIDKMNFKSMTESTGMPALETLTLKLPTGKRAKPVAGVTNSKSSVTASSNL